MTKIRANEDSPWKLLLRKYFREAIEFFFPNISHLIDWTKAIVFLDTEFQKITPDAEIAKDDWRKFGVIPDRTIARINQLPIAQLEALGEALLDFGTIEDLTTWLDRAD